MSPRYDRKIIHDDGRLVIYRISTAKYIGYRTEKNEEIQACSAAKIKQIHDLKESRERLQSAGLWNERPAHSPNKSPWSEKNAAKRNALYKLQRKWMTRAWTNDSH